MVKLSVLIILLFIWVKSTCLAQFTRVFGQSTTNEKGKSITTDSLKNIYFGSSVDGNAWIVKIKETTIWSKRIMTSPYAADVSAIGVVADTVFGCGYLYQGNVIEGSFYFKMKASDGSLYWFKADESNKSYFASMVYAKGKFFLTGSVVNGTTTNYDGKVICVASSDGSLQWETPGLGVTFGNFDNDYIDDFTGTTEMVDGKMYITGRSYINAGSTNMRPLLIGIDEFGSIFCQKYLLFDFNNTSLAKRVYGYKISYTNQKDSLIIGIFGDINCTSDCSNYVTGLIKTDLEGNIDFAKFYDVVGVSKEIFCFLNVTEDAYVFYGVGNFNTSDQNNFVLKTSRNGNFVKGLAIDHNTAVFSSLDYLINFGGTSKYADGLHYFITSFYSNNVNLKDIVMNVIDDDLTILDNCFSFSPISVNEISIDNTKGEVLLHNKNSENNYLSLYSMSDFVASLACAESTIDTVTFIENNELVISVSSGSATNPIFVWSNGVIGSQNILKPEELLIVEMYDPSNCCVTRDSFFISQKDFNNWGGCPYSSDEIVIPNILTLSKDKKNDKFLIVNKPDCKDKLMILNRWGNVVFEACPYENDFSSGNLTEGHYFYIYYPDFGESFYKSGFVYLEKN